MKMATKAFTTVCILLVTFLSSLIDGMNLNKTRYEEILEATHRSCVVCIPEALTNEDALFAFSATMKSFSNELGVSFHMVDFSSGIGGPFTDNGNLGNKELLSIDYNNCLVLFKHYLRDRSCLLSPPASPSPEFRVYSFDKEVDYSVDKLVRFINIHCDTFRKSDGNLTTPGIHKEHILKNLYSVTPSHTDNMGTKRTDSVCMRGSNSKSNSVCSSHNDFQDKDADVDSEKFTTPIFQEMQHCERIQMPTSSEFINDYLSLSKPVVITGATSNWSAFSKWTKEFLLDQYGDAKAHIKITPTGEYEGVESAKMWENKSKIKIPKQVLEKLPYPDLVVVRPATMEITFSEFLHLINNISSSKTANISAYLEYSSISQFPRLKDDIDEMTFIKSILNLKQTNIWLSDGNTVGKLHFDPFDNFMCQISGEKEFIIYEPHQNQRLYEGHIQEAILSYNTSSRRFSRHKLLESTSMVMSPVDIQNPDLQRFPKFAEAKPMSCTIKPGEVLFTPAFWWHEVRSTPNVTELRNLAVNFWYEPFFLKEFPCPECKLYMNPKYFHLL